MVSVPHRLFVEFRLHDTSRKSSFAAAGFEPSFVDVYSMYVRVYWCHHPPHVFHFPPFLTTSYVFLYVPVTLASVATTAAMKKVQWCFSFFFYDWFFASSYPASINTPPSPSLRLPLPFAVRYHRQKMPRVSRHATCRSRFLTSTKPLGSQPRGRENPALRILVYRQHYCAPQTNQFQMSLGRFYRFILSHVWNGKYSVATTAAAARPTAPFGQPSESFSLDMP